MSRLLCTFAGYISIVDYVFYIINHRYADGYCVGYGGFRDYAVDFAAFVQSAKRGSLRMWYTDTRELMDAV